MKFDIIIIGGGMVGAAMACALQPSSLKIALIDAAPLTASDDHRLIALNYSSICLLKNLHVWSALSSYATSIQEVHVSHRKHFGITRLTAAELNMPTLGHVVPAKYINAALYENLKNVTLIRPGKLKNLSQNENKVTVQISTPNGEEELTAKVVIGADGTRSTVRDLLNIEAEETDYQQTALVTTTELNRPHKNIAYERFQNAGAIAMLPLLGECVGTVWTDNNEIIAQLMELSDDQFLEKLQKQFGYRLGRLKKTTQRFTYPLKMIQAKQKIKDRVILIGNAAHTLSPLAAQGLNLALFEIAELADYFQHVNFESFSLQDFSSQQQKISTRLSHNLTWVFANDFFMLNAARQIGMIGLDLCYPLKKHFTQRAIGKSGKTPSLLRERETHEIISS